VLGENFISFEGKIGTSHAANIIDYNLLQMRFLEEIDLQVGRKNDGKCL
jgi:hypothetical protein